MKTKWNIVFLTFLGLIALNLDILAFSQEDDVYLRVEGIYQLQGLVRNYKFYPSVHWDVVNPEKKFEFAELGFVEEKMGLEVDYKNLFTRKTISVKIDKIFEYQQFLMIKTIQIPRKHYFPKFKRPEAEINRKFVLTEIPKHAIETKVSEYYDKLPTIPQITILRKSINISTGIKHAVELSPGNLKDMITVIPKIEEKELLKNIHFYSSIGVIFSSKETSGFVSFENFSSFISESDLIFKEFNLFVPISESFYSLSAERNSLQTNLFNPYISLESFVASNMGYTSLSFPVQILNVRGSIGLSITNSNGNFGVFPLFDFGFSNSEIFFGFKGDFESQGYKFNLLGLYKDLKVSGYVGYSTMEKLPIFGTGIAYSTKFLTPFVGIEGNLEDLKANFALTTGPFNFGRLNVLSDASIKTDLTVKGTDIMITLEVGSILKKFMLNLKGFLALEKGELNYGGGISVQF
ncbi:MAG: hypothetical protein PWQ20_745 [Thermotogaceae bacterium]|nr:hypothetical protein [Thermotogaceae bacterium]